MTKEVINTINHYIYYYSKFEQLSDNERLALISVVGHDGYLRIINKERICNRGRKKSKNASKKSYLSQCHKLSRKTFKLEYPDVKLEFKGNNIDHQISVTVGYKCNIPVEVISHIDNLTLLSNYQNKVKLDNCIVTDKNRWIYDEYIHEHDDLDAIIHKFTFI